jgi:hypothetical protein
MRRSVLIMDRLLRLIWRDAEDLQSRTSVHNPPKPAWPHVPIATHGTTPREYSEYPV